MTRELLRNFLLDELLQVEDKEIFSEEANLFELGLDSLGIMRLVFFVEQTMHIIIPEESISANNMYSIRAIAELIDSLK